MSASGPFARLIRECLRTPLQLSSAVVALGALSASQLALPWAIKAWVEGPLMRGAAVATGGYIAGAVAIIIVIALLLVTSRVLLASVNQHLLERLRDAAMRQSLGTEPLAVWRYPTGELMSRIFQDAGALSSFVELLLKRVLGDGLLAAGAVVMMFVLDRRLAFAACVLVPLVGLLLARLGVVIRRWGSVAQREMGDLSATAAEQLAGLPTIKGYQTESWEASRFASGNRRYRQRVVRAEVWAALLVGSVFLVAAVGFVVAIAYGTHEVSAGGLGAGGLLAFCLYAAQTVEPLRRLAEMHGALQRALAAAQRLFELVDLPGGEEGRLRAVAPPARALPDGGRPAARAAASVRGEVRLVGLRFRYRAEQPVLEGVDLGIGAGERVAIVAASGGGKSTLASLLLRFHDPCGGVILLDGVELERWQLGEIRRAICVVAQEPFLFSGPIIDNIRYGSFGASADAVADAARLAGLDALVAERPEGLGARCREGGRDLSGGQRQRIALARAIVRNPRVLVLDEATSALDGEVEGQIFAGLDDWLSRRTVIVMAHRLSTLGRAPRIVVVHAGRVVGEGSLAQLVRESALFRELLGDQLAAPGGLAGALGA